MDVQCWHWEQPPSGEHLGTLGVGQGRGPLGLAPVRNQQHHFVRAGSHARGGKHAAASDPQGLS